MDIQPTLVRQNITLDDDIVEYAQLNHESFECGTRPSVTLDDDLQCHNYSFKNSPTKDRLLLYLNLEVTPKWYQFGLALGISEEIIDTYTPFPPEKCLVEILDFWFKHRYSQPTWMDVVKALKKVKLHQLAESVLKDECEEHTETLNVSV